MPKHLRHFDADLFALVRSLTSVIALLLSAIVSGEAQNVGIGTNAPVSRLHVAGLNPTLTVGPFGVGNAVGRIVATGTAAEISFVRRTLGSWPGAPAAGDRYVWYDPDGSARLWTEVNGDLVTVRSNGNVGIGRTDPSHRLDVVGSARVRNALIVGSQPSSIEGAQVVLANANVVDPPGETCETWSLDVISLGTNDPGMGAFRIFDASTYCTNRCLYPPFFLRTRLVGGQYLPRLHLYGDNPFHLLHLNLDDAAKPSTSTWTVLSDGRLKEVLGPYSKGLKHLLRLSAVEYRYKNPEDGQASSLFPSQVLEKVHVGFVAQEVASIFPEAVSRNDGGYLCLNIHPILVAYVNALKELHRRQIELESALLQMRDALREIERLREAVEVLRLQLSQKGKIEER